MSFNLDEFEFITHESSLPCVKLYSKLQLREKGFTKMDALEPNKVMLNAAKKNNLYNKYYIEYITKDPSNSIKESK